MIYRSTTRKPQTRKGEKEGKEVHNNEKRAEERKISSAEIDKGKDPTGKRVEWGPRNVYRNKNTDEWGSECGAMVNGQFFEPKTGGTKFVERWDAFEEDTSLHKGSNPISKCSGSRSITVIGNVNGFPIIKSLERPHSCNAANTRTYKLLQQQRCRKPGGRGKGKWNDNDSGGKFHDINIDIYE